MRTEKIIKAPWTKEQVEALNRYQAGPHHPYTCAAENSQMCVRAAGTGEGVLMATTDGWRCPCGFYTQNWAHEVSTEIE